MTSILRRLTPLFLTLVVAAQGRSAFRPPSIPLVTHDPSFTAWCSADALPGTWPRHWTGRTLGMAGLIRVDGKTWRWMGAEPSTVEAAKQTGLTLGALTTRFDFEVPGVRFHAEWTTPAIPGDIDLYARTVTYLTLHAEPSDGQPHDIAWHVDASGEWVTHAQTDAVTWSRHRLADGLTAVCMAPADRKPLARKGDDTGPDGGSLWLAARVPLDDASLGDDVAVRGAFVRNRPVPDDVRMPRPANDRWPLVALTARGADASILIGYDHPFVVEYLHRKLVPYWKRDGADIGGLLARAASDREAVLARCRAFDASVAADLAPFGRAYADVATLAFRQVGAAQSLAADFDGTALLFPKECFSNGCIATVDVIYPSFPFYLKYSPELGEALLRPIMAYAASKRWKFPFAPHDLGTWPYANGQVYGGGETGEENQMPVEESGNMILMLAALARMHGRSDLAVKHGAMVHRWATYLVKHGPDPVTQLCTDDFAGHLAGNVNLAFKAAAALAAYRRILEPLGLPKLDGVDPQAIAADIRRRAEGGKGDGLRLAFDRPDTWSQKYNLVWDRVLGLELLPPDQIRKEWTATLSRVEAFGVPLDNRQPYTKVDWCLWTAAMAPDMEGFEAMVKPLWKFFHETADRVPMTDWFRTREPKMMGMHHRSVVGGIFMPLIVPR